MEGTARIGLICTDCDAGAVVDTEELAETLAYFHTNNYECETVEWPVDTETAREGERCTTETEQESAP